MVIAGMMGLSSKSRGGEKLDEERAWCELQQRKDKQLKWLKERLLEREQKERGEFKYLDTTCFPGADIHLDTHRSNFLGC